MRRKFLTLFILVMITITLTSCVEPKEPKSEEPKSEEPKGEVLVEKPVIYLYPTEEKEIEVILNYAGELICTYPIYEEGWNVIAQADGTIINSSDGREYSYLFWEGISEYVWEINKGFVIEGEKTVEFLQDKLSYLGLSPKEYNEFIVYWLPRMKDNKYNLIYFAEEEYETLAELCVNPEPNSIIRVFMVYKALDKPIDIEAQELEPKERQGFTVVEWGGTEIN